MSPRHAAHLPTGAHIRRKGATGDDAVYTVERVERPINARKGSVTIHAGGHAFKAWEVERVDPHWGWPKEPGA